MFSIRSNNLKYTALVDLKGGFIRQAKYENFDIFYKNPWFDEVKNNNSIDDLTKNLGGEFFCLPFGHSSIDDNNFKSNYHHGVSCNTSWKLIELKDTYLTIELSLSQEYDIKRIIKTITVNDNSINVVLEIEPRNKCSLPIGTHPCFKTQEGVAIQAKGRCVSYPISVHTDKSMLKPNSIFKDLYHCDTLNNHNLDLSQLPLSFESEEIVQLIEPQGEITLLYPNSAKKITFKWDKDILPSCLLWISNKGRDYFPWNGRNLCLGVEPINSAWDLGNKVYDDCILDKLSVSKSFNFEPNKTVNLSYSFSVEDLK